MPYLVRKDAEEISALMASSREYSDEIVVKINEYFEKYGSTKTDNAIFGMWLLARRMEDEILRVVNEKKNIHIKHKSRRQTAHFPDGRYVTLVSHPDTKKSLEEQCIFHTDDE
jgi:hypothetical protein